LILLWDRAERRRLTQRSVTVVATDRLSAKRVQAHRDRLWAQGLRPVQIWVPDTRTAEFVREAHRQSQAIAASEGAAGDQAFVDAVSWDAVE
jgi:hypothetical protein